MLGLMFSTTSRRSSMFSAQTTSSWWATTLAARTQEPQRGHRLATSSRLVFVSSSGHSTVTPTTAYVKFSGIRCTSKVLGKKNSKDANGFFLRRTHLHRPSVLQVASTDIRPSTSFSSTGMSSNLRTQVRRLCPLSHSGE